MKIKLLGYVFISMILTISASFMSYAAEKKDYTIQSAGWNGNENAIYAQWDEPENPTSVELVLYKIQSGKNKKITTVSAEGSSYDFTADIIDKGTGEYYFSVKPKKGKVSEGTYSETIKIESDYLKQLRNVYIQAQKDADPYYSKAYNEDGTLKTVTVRCKEGNIPDGQIRELEIVSANNCELVSSSIELPYDQWQMGRKMTVTVVLKAKDGYSFTPLTEYKCSLLKYQSDSGDEKNRTVVFTFTPRIKLPGITGLTVDASGMMKWDTVDQAGYYYLTLRNGADESIYNGKVKTNHYDLSEHLEEIDTVQIYASSKTEGYLRSDTLKIDEFQKFYNENQLTGRFKKSGSSLMYYDESGEAVKGWQKIGGIWYYFDENGLAVGPGWWQDTDNPNDPNAASGGSWYYFDSEHRMLADTVTPDGRTVDANGRRVN